MSNYGLKISKEGVNVGTASDQDLYFSSNFNYLKVSSSGTQSISVPTGSGVGTTSIAHGLSFVPVALCYLKATGGTALDNTYLLPQRISDGFGFSPMCYYNIDGTNLNIEIVKPSSGTTTWNLRYYIFYNNLE